METKEFDENDAIQFIRGYVPAEIKDKYSGDEILLLIDTMYDFYENHADDYEPNGGEDDYQRQLGELVKYVKKSLLKDPGNTIEIDDVEALIEGELEYESTLEED